MSIKHLPQGERVYLTFPSVEGADEFLAAQKVSLGLHDNWVHLPQAHEQFAHYIKRFNQTTHFSFWVRKKEGDDLVGVININEIIRGAFQNGILGFFAFEGFQGQGLMSEGLKLVVSYAFGVLGLHRLEANIQSENTQSLQFIKRNHFRHEGYSPHYLKIGENWKGHERFAFTQEDRG